eukprot:COSAG06_NODE_8687_length_2096_cov_46.839760_2_plen_152_part_00
MILRSSPFASPPSLAAYSLLVPHSFSIPSFVRNLGKFSNSIPLLVIFDCRFLVTPFDPRPETRCNRRARPKEKFCRHQRSLAPTTLRSLLSCSSIPYILLYRLYIIYIYQTHHSLSVIERGCRSHVIRDGRAGGYDIHTTDASSHCCRRVR